MNWNGWRECIECLDSLLAQNHKNFHTFIVDNDSRDQSIEHISAWCNEPKAGASWRRHPGVDHLTEQPHIASVQYRIVEHAEPDLRSAPDGCQLTLVRSGGNLGFAGGCNVGIKVAGLHNFDYLWFLNADTVVERQALVELIRRAVKDPAIGMVGSTIRFYDAPDVVQVMAGARLNRSNGTTSDIGHGAHLSDVPADGSAVERELSYIMGASMLVSAKYIAEIGPMDEDYFLYYEDLDWAWRGRDKFSLGFAPGSYIFHKWGANSHKESWSFSAKLYYGNRLRFVTRHLPGRVPAAMWSLFEQMLRHIARGRWEAALVVLSTLLMAGRYLTNVKPSRQAAPR